MYANHELARESWTRFLDEVSMELFNAEVSVEIIGAPGASQREVDGLALQALGYDGRDDIFEVAAARGAAHLPSVVRHVVDRPERIAVDSAKGMAPTRITVDGRDGVRTVVRISRPADFSG